MDRIHNDVVAFELYKRCNSDPIEIGNGRGNGLCHWMQFNVRTLYSIKI